MGSVSLIRARRLSDGRATIRSRETFVAVIWFLALVVMFSLPFAIYCIPD